MIPSVQRTHLPSAISAAPCVSSVTTKMLVCQPGLSLSMVPGAPAFSASYLESFTLSQLVLKSLLSNCVLSPCGLLRWSYICHRPSSDKICRALLLIFIYWFGHSMRVLLLLFHFCLHLGFNPCLYFRSCPTMCLHPL